MTDAASGANPPSSAGEGDEKCPLCGRKKHDTGKYQRNRSERKKALLADAADPESGLSQRARAFIRRHNGELVPPGHEVSHEVPLAVLPKGERCKLDKHDIVVSEEGKEGRQMRTRRRGPHRARHKRCSVSNHAYGR